MASDFKVSVIICTHNPRQEYLTRTIAALQMQDLPKEEWELLIIDNASTSPVSEILPPLHSLSSRVVRECKLGLTHARLRGIREATGDLLVLVDDDNVLNSNYLCEAIRIGNEWPRLGAWGGQIIPEFEIAPPPWPDEVLGYLGIRRLDGDRWSNLGLAAMTNPIGAGMCIRRPVAARYAQTASSDPARASLDRQGQSLLSCGDTDMAFTSVDLGLGTGVFCSLSLTHLISAKRLTEDYLLKLVEDTTYSCRLLENIREGTVPRSSSYIDKLKWWRHYLRQSERQRKVMAAMDRGHQRAVAYVASKSSALYAEDTGCFDSPPVPIATTGSEPL